MEDQGGDQHPSHSGVQDLNQGLPHGEQQSNSALQTVNIQSSRRTEEQHSDLLIDLSQERSTLSFPRTDGIVSHFNDEVPGPIQVMETSSDEKITSDDDHHRQVQLEDNMKLLENIITGDHDDPSENVLLQVQIVEVGDLEDHHHQQPITSSSDVGSAQGNIPDGANPDAHQSTLAYPKSTSNLEHPLHDLLPTQTGSENPDGHCLSDDSSHLPECITNEESSGTHGPFDSSLQSAEAEFAEILSVATSDTPFHENINLILQENTCYQSPNRQGLQESSTDDVPDDLMQAKVLDSVAVLQDSQEERTGVALLQVLTNAGVNLSQGDFKVISIEDSIYECKNATSPNSHDDSPVKVKVYSVSTNDGSQGTIIMKDIFSGTIPENIDDIVNKAELSRKSQESKRSSINDKEDYNRVLKCSQCPATFSLAAKNKFRVHLKLHKSNKSHSCQHCGRCFSRKFDVARHIKRLHSSPTNRTIHQCPQCDKSYKDKANLRQHMQAVHEGVYRYICQDCGKGYHRLVEFNVHRSKHTGLKTYECDRCSERFSRKQSLTIHLRKHTGDLPYQCDQCNKRFIDSSKLSQHKKVHVPFKETLKTRQCSRCPKRFASKRDLEAHERSQHTGVKPFVCATCDKAYSAKSSLQEHARIHGKRELTCEICQKAFYKKFVLKEHMKVHTQEMSFMCQFCAKRFRYGSNFRTHEKNCLKKV